jgi:putative oxidoreductase
MNRMSSVALSLLRIVSGFILFCPGTMKLFGWFGGMPGGLTPSTLPPRLLAAGWIEVVAGPLLVFGLFTRPVAFLVSGEMAFAYFIGHFPHGFLPIQNHGEPAVLLCFIFLYLAAAGPGAISADHLIGRGREARREGGGRETTGRT